MAAWWNRFWFGPASARAYAAHRVLLGVFLLWYFGGFWPHVELLFSRDGIYLPVLLPDFAPPPAVAWGVYLLTLAACALLVAGWRTVYVAPAVFVLFTYHYLLSIAGRDTSYDRLIVLMLLFGSFAPAARGRKHVSGFAARLLCFQVAALYFGSGLWKLVNPRWHDGKLLEMVLIGPWGTDAGRWVVNLGWSGGVYSLLGWSVIVLELALGPALYMRRLRIPAMVIGLGFHISVWVFLQIPEFLVCVTVYPLYFAWRSVPHPDL